MRILSNMPTSEPEEYVVRIYCVQAIDLQPNDPNGMVGIPLVLRMCPSRTDSGGCSEDLLCTGHGSTAK